MTQARVKTIITRIKAGVTPANWTNIKNVFGGVLKISQYGL